MTDLKRKNATIFPDFTLLQESKLIQHFNAKIHQQAEMSERCSKSRAERSQPVKIKLCAEPRLLAQRRIKLMDQGAGAKHMKPIYFQGCRRCLCDARTQPRTCTRLKVTEARVRVGGISISNPLAAQQRWRRMANL